MKKKGLALAGILVLLLCACGKVSDDTQATGGTDTEVSSEVNTEEPESSEEQSSEEAETEESEPAADVWVPEEAPPVRNIISEEDKMAQQQAILDKGTFLFSGDTNVGYYPSDIAWLQGAAEDDVVAVLYSCEDITHGGWGILGVDADVDGKHLKLEDVLAASDEPRKQRLLVYTVKQLTEMAGIESPDQFDNFTIGAWSAGKIHGIYYLQQDAAAELQQHLAQIEETEQIIHTYNGELSNENAIESAKSVYNYLKEVYGTACLTGQMESTWKGTPDYEMNFIEENTGKLPAIRGLDFMNNDYSGVAKRAQEWWEKGGIPTICWHTGSTFATGYQECLGDNIKWTEAFEPGSDTYNRLLEGMDRAVPYLQQLEDAGVPILWRPFHELDGGWFWWSKGGSENFVKLWQLMYSRYTDYWGLDNLIWVYGFSGNGGEMDAWYPGDDYVDLIGADSYTAGANAHLYEGCDEMAPEGMPIVFHECGTIPTEEQMAEAETPWLYFMVWHTDHLTDGTYNTEESLNEVYNSDYFITLDELPEF